MNLFLDLIIKTVTLLIVSYLIPGFYFADLRAVIITAVVIGVINAFIRPVLQLIALPLTILSLGLFAFLINVALLWFTASIVPGFTIDSFFTAAVASIIIALTGAFLHKLTK